MVRFIQNLVFCMCMLIPQWLYAGATATLDQQISSMGESVQLSVKVEGEEDGDPDFRPLQQQFDILNQSQSSNYSIINGNISKSKQWQLTLMPKREGLIIIPALRIGALHTQPLTLRVLPQSTAGQQDKDIQLQATTNQQEVYVQAQLVLTVKLLRAVNLAQAELSEPEVPHCIVKKLGEDRTYETVLNQRRFVVTERKYALFPQNSGTVEIPALQFDGRIALGRSMFNQSGKAVRIQSDPISIHVVEKDRQWDKSKTWLPAKELSLRELWTDGQSTSYKVGEPLTRTFEMKATGLTAAQLPALFSAQELDGFKQYPDQPVLHDEVNSSGISGVRTEKVALIPTKAGEMTLPGVSIAWWNTETKTVQTMMIPSRVIEVLPADEVQNTRQAADLPAKVQSKDQAEKQPVVKVEQDSISSEESTFWQLATALFALLWLGTLLLWWLKSKGLKGKEKGPEAENLKLKSVQRELYAACKSNEAAKVMSLLLSWAKLYYQDEELVLLGQLKGRSAQLDAALAELENHLYGQGGERVWSGAGLCQVLQSLQPESRDTEQKEALKPLYH